MRRAIRGSVAAAALTLAGCVNGFEGANVQLDLSPATPVQAGALAPPGPGELPAAMHFTLYAITETTTDQTTQAHLFEVGRFEVHHIVDTSSPCFIDVGDHVPHAGLHVTQFARRLQQDTGIMDPAHPPAGATQAQIELVATAQQRMTDIAALTGPGGLVAVTSASEVSYPGLAADCNGPADQIPPPTCMDDASNQRRLQLCQKTWKSFPELWEGTDRVLTAPLNGTTFGMVLNPDTPVTHTPVGGAQLFVENALVGIDAYAIYLQADGATPTDGPGQQLYFGRPTMPTRGVFHVHLVNPDNAALTAEMAVFADLGGDDVHF